MRERRRSSRRRSSSKIPPPNHQTILLKCLDQNLGRWREGEKKWVTVGEKRGGGGREEKERGGHAVRASDGVWRKSQSAFYRSSRLLSEGREVSSSLLSSPLIHLASSCPVYCQLQRLSEYMCVCVRIRSLKISSFSKCICQCCTCTDCFHSFYVYFYPFVDAHTYLGFSHL